MASKTKSKPKAKPKKKDVVSPGVGENFMGEGDGDDEGERVEKAGDSELQVGPRRRLRKATSDPVHETKDSEEMESDEDKEKVPLEEVETEPLKEPDVEGSPTAEELNQQLVDLLARPFISEAEGERVEEEQQTGEEQGAEKSEEEVAVMDEEKEEEEGDVERKEKSLFTPSRLSVPSTRMVRRCMDSMMGAATHTTIRSMPDFL
ncbi:hypothetical protein Dimus_005498 [Dionaea muscipula]